MEENTKFENNENDKKKLKKKFLIPVIVVLVLALGIIIYAAVTNLMESRTNTFTSTQISNAVQESTTADISAEDVTIVLTNDGSDTSTNTSTSLSKTFTWTDDDGYDTSSATKYVRILNVDDDENNTDAYIRVAIIPSWTSSVETEEVDAEGNAVFVDVDVINNDELLYEDEDGNTCYGFYGLTFGTNYNANEAYWKNSDGDVIVLLTLANDWSDSWFYCEEDGYFYYKSIVAPGETTSVLLTGVTIANNLLDNIDEAGDSIQFELDIISDSVQAKGGAIADSEDGTDADSVRWKNVHIASDGTLTDSTD